MLAAPAAMLATPAAMLAASTAARPSRRGAAET